MRNWRKMTWALWIWSALIVVWIVSGTNAADCGSQPGDTFLTAREAQAACEAGTGIGAAIVLFIGFCGFVFLSLIWFMTRPKEKAPPTTSAPAGFYADPQGTGAERYWDGIRWTEQLRHAAPVGPPPPPASA